MENSRDELTQFSATSQGATGAVQTLQNRINELGDEFGRAERKGSSLNRTTTALTASVSALSVSVMGFNSTQLAGMITGFGTLLTTIVPLTSSIVGLTAAVGGLGAGFGAVAATGLVAFREENGKLTEALQPAREQLRQTALELGEEFVPLIEDAIAALPQFIRLIGEAVGDLTPFANALRDAGEVAFDVLPEMVEFFLQLGRESLPRLRELGRWLANNWQNILETSVETLRELTPVLLGFIDGMIDLLGPMNEFGTTVLQEVLPAVNNFISTLGDAIETVQDNARLIRAVLIGSFIAITGPLGAVITLLVNFREEVANSLGTLNEEYIQPFVEGFNSAFENNLSEVLEETTETISLAVESLTGLFGLGSDAEEWGETVGEAVNSVQDALITVNDLAQGEIGLSSIFDFSGVSGGETLSQTGRTIQNVSRMVTTAASDASVGIESLRQGFTRALPEIRQALTALENAFQGYLNFFNTVLLPFYRAQLQGFVIPLFNDLAAVIGQNLAPFIDELGQTITALNGHFRTLGNVASTVWGAIDGVVVPIATALGSAIRDNLVLVVDSLFEGMKAVMNLVQGDFGAAATNLENILGNVISGAFNFIGFMRTALTAVGDWLVSEGWEIATSAFSALPQIIAGLLSAGGGFLADALQSLTTWIAQSPDVLTDLAADIGNAIGTAVENAITDALNAVNPANAVNGRVLPGGGIPGEGNLINGPLLQSGGFIQSGGMAMLHAGERVVPAAQVSDRGQVQVDASSGPIEVVVKGDTGVIEEVTARKMNEQTRRQRRNSGRTTHITRG